MSLTHHFSSLWAEGRTRFSKQLENLQENDLRKTLPPAPNSAGFLIRHLADVELLFARNVFKFADVQVHAKTVIAQRDTREWTNLQELLDYQQKAADTLKKPFSQSRIAPGTKPSQRTNSVPKHWRKHWAVSQPILLTIPGSWL